MSWHSSVKKSSPFLPSLFLPFSLSTMWTHQLAVYLIGCYTWPAIVFMPQWLQIWPTGAPVSWPCMSLTCVRHTWNASTLSGAGIGPGLSSALLKPGLQSACSSREMVFRNKNPDPRGGQWYCEFVTSRLCGGTGEQGSAKLTSCWWGSRRQEGGRMYL